jgi:subtilisin family serine protease
LADLSSRVPIGDRVAIDLDPDESDDAVRFAVRHRDVGVTLNHLVTGLQRRTGYPDGDPEPSDGPLPSFPEGSTKGEGVTVAVIDTGYPTPSRVRDDLEETWFTNSDYATQPGEVDDLGRDLRHIDLIDGDRDGFLDAEAGHGLFVAGLVRRLAPAARLLFLKALNSDGMGTEQGVARAIRYAVARDAHVINLSLGFYTLDDDPPADVAQAVSAAIDAGCAVISAAGNDAIEDRTYPAALENVIGVGALGEDRQSRASFSNRGDWVNVYAPGERVQSTYVVGREDRRTTRDRNADTFRDTAVWSGTSFACGIVSGHIAASLSRDGESPHRQAAALVEHLPGFDGAVRLDPAEAL